MNLEDDVRRWLKMPAQLRAGQALGIGRKLGLGQRRVKIWLAHGARRSKRPGHKQWSYPRDATVQGLLDMAGIELTIAPTRLLAGGRGTEGVSGSTTHDPA